MMERFTLDNRYGKYAGQELEILFPEDRIRQRVRELGQQISSDYQGRIPIFIGVLNGSFIFFSDLLREITIDGEVDFIKISSYANETRTSGTVRLLKDISCDITGRDVILVEDIIDSGLSIQFLKRRMLESEASSVRIAAFLIKSCARVDFEIDYVGFQIPDRFVVGYGLDLAQRLRNLKSIYAFK